MGWRTCHPLAAPSLTSGEQMMPVSEAEIEAATKEFENGICQINDGDIGEGLAWKLLGDPEILRNIAKAALEAAAAARWQPIETFPKDSKEDFLLGCFSEHHGMFIAHYDERPGAFAWKTADGPDYPRD